MRTVFTLIGSFLLVAAGLYFFGSGVTAFNHVWFDGGRPPILSEQLGRRGTGTQQLYNPTRREELLEANVIPASVPPPGDEGPRAGDVYENVKVLGDVSAGAFTRLMVNMTEWVAPEEGCAACHNVENFADDGLYTKVVARRMLEMVRDINANWTEHVADTGVTCYTCHRGALVPANIWFNKAIPTRAANFLEGTAQARRPVGPRAMSPDARDPLSTYLEGDAELRVTETAPRNGDNPLEIRHARGTHALMIHMSQALGVNCTYCHHTRAFNDWNQSRPQRTTAWYGIRMVRELNNDYLKPLVSVFPDHRLGEAMGDAPKLNCATCHNGVYKPLFGEPMARNFPELTGETTTGDIGRSAAASPMSNDPAP